MKRTILITLLLLLVVLSGCGSSTNSLPLNTSQDETIDVIFGTHFQKIDGRDDLVFDIDTENVFYLFSIDYNLGSNSGSARGFLSPYIGQNGHYCKYIDGEIIEFDFVDGEIVYF